MMMRCASGKVCHDTEHQAELALIQARARFGIDLTKGPVNFYACNSCGTYHLTSKGEINSILEDPLVKDAIKKEHLAASWEDRFRRR